MKKVNLEEIQKWTIIKSVLGKKENIFSKITFDSREACENSVFIAVKGVQTDGHNYIDKAIENGCRIIVCQSLPENINNKVTYLMVDDSALALGQIASGFFDNPSDKLKLVGVTGTNGKTTIATLLYKLFLKLGYKAGLFSTVANYIFQTEVKATHTTPDPIALNKLMSEMVEEGCDYCFMEVSSHAIDQKRIAGLTFDGAVFTNITHDHLDYHVTFDNYLNAKKMFFDNLSNSAFALFNTDDKHGKIMVQNCNANKYSYSIRSMADYKAKIIENSFEGMQLIIDNQEMWTKFIGFFNAQNILAVYASAILLKQNKQEVLIALSSLDTVSGRFQSFRFKNDITVIVDYAHTPDALKNVMKTIKDICGEQIRLISVVGAGGNRDKSKRPEMAYFATKFSEKVILTSDNPRFEDPQSIIDDMKKGVDDDLRFKVISIVNRKEAIRTACALANPGDVVLVAGKGHETYQEIKGVKHNFDDREIVKEYFNSIV